MVMNLLKSANSRLSGQVANVDVYICKEWH